MYDFSPDPALAPEERYRQLNEAADAITSSETDSVANMANVAALLWEFVPDLNWAGFYRIDPVAPERGLVLGPFVGRPACIRIPLGKGVCGAAAAQGKSLLVDDVTNFPGHIACDSLSRAELVVPINFDGEVKAVIDLDSPIRARFSDTDRRGVEELAALVAERV